MRWRGGGCHCGAVRYEVLTPDEIEVEDCNCSICRMTGFLHLVAPANRFRLIRGADRLTRYAFGSRTAQHLFCSICGVKSYYVPRSNPDGFSVNLRCLDDPDDFADIRIVKFDGRGDWEASAALIAHKSRS
ncbi:MAG: GFA family protein [Hyphomonadaceae bacterium]